MRFEASFVVFHGFQRAKQHGSRRRKFAATASPVEQVASVMRFKLADVLRYGGLGNVQLRRRPRKAAQLAHGQERVGSVVQHGVSYAQASSTASSAALYIASSIDIIHI